MVVLLGGMLSRYSFLLIPKPGFSPPHPIPPATPRPQEGHLGRCKPEATSKSEPLQGTVTPREAEQAGQNPKVALLTTSGSLSTLGFDPGDGRTSDCGQFALKRQLWGPLYTLKLDGRSQRDFLYWGYTLIFR